MFKVAVAFACVLTASAANAALITLLSGDKDCFGLGGTCSIGDSYSTDLGGVFFTDNSTATDPDGTDIWDAGFDPSFTYSLGLAGATVTGASLDLFVAGPDLGTGISLDFNGTFIGSYLEAVGSENNANLVNFIVPVSALLDGVNTLTVTASSGGDGYIIDYSELFVDTEMAQDVPVPTTLALCVLGLLGLGWKRRKAA
jgi:hypothetical protein